MTAQTTVRAGFKPAHAITAILALAITFTFSCSSDSDDNPPPPAAAISSSSGGGGFSSGGGGLSFSGGSSSGGNACAAWGDWAQTTAPTCEAAGVETRACTSGNSSPETRPKAQLVWSNWSVTSSATCEVAGLETRTCPGNASPDQTRPIAKLVWGGWEITTPETLTTLAEGTRTCPNGDTDVKDLTIDERDNKVYKAVVIGTKTWMAENLNYEAEGSKCGNGSSLSDANTTTCDTYGRLYNWATAMANSASSTANPSGVQGVCPEGWHIPSGAEWNALIKVANPSCVDNSACAGAGTKLKANSGWNSYNNIPAGTDDFGFAALPGGRNASLDGSFSGVGEYGFWWSSSENSDNSFAWLLVISYNNQYTSVNGYAKYLFISVRCVKD